MNWFALVFILWSAHFSLSFLLQLLLFFCLEVTSIVHLVTEVFKVINYAGRIVQMARYCIKCIMGMYG